MPSKKLCVFLLILSMTYESDQTGLGLLTGVSTVVKIIDGVFDVFGSVKYIFTEEENPGSIDKDELISEINNRISTAKFEMLQYFVIVSKTKTIDEAFMTIHSSLIDLKHFINATDNERETFRELFIERYESNNVEVHTRFLRQLLTFDSLGTTDKLLRTLTEQQCCNMTSFYEFKEFYFKLLSDGITLDMVYLALAKPLAVEKTTKFWKKEITILDGTFDSEETACESKFSAHATADLQKATDAGKLQRENKQRYLKKWNDVLFFPRIGLNQTQAFAFDEDDIFHEISDVRNKIAVFGKKGEQDTNSRRIKDILNKSKAEIRGVISGQDDDSAAQKVRDKILSVLEKENLTPYVKAVLVFFADTEPKNVAIDNDSPVTSMTIDDITLKYCSASWVKCWISYNIWDPEENIKIGHGSFRIYIYPYNKPKANGVSNGGEK